MKTRMLVVAREAAESTTGTDRTRITLKHCVTDSETDMIRLTLTPTQAKPFRLGRYINVDLTPN